jgi:hypothetical protein
MSSEPKPEVSFREVLRDELKEIRLRREQRLQAKYVSRREGTSDPAADAPAKGKAGEDQAAAGKAAKAKHQKKELPQDEDEKSLLEQALHDDLCGLSISGGGIRSATFALGVLQAFAATNFLPKFDYVSAVSGGGYIGSWLVAWIHRAGLRTVIDKLKPAPFANNSRGYSPDPEAIHHLRLYSNYLAPRIGLFSLDSWVLISIYLRNLLLNQLVLGLILLAVFGFARTVVELFTLSYTSPRFDHWIAYVLIASVVPAFIALVGFALHARRQSMAFLSIAAILLTSAIGSLWLLNSFDDLLKPASHGSRAHSLLWWSPVVLGILHGVIGLCIVLGRESARITRELQESGADPSKIYWPRLQKALGAKWGDVVLAGLFGLLAGAIGGLVFWGTTYLASRLTLRVAPIAVLGPPVIIGVFILANYLHVGLLGAILPRYDRERWSSLNARCHVLQLWWLGALGITVYGPWLIEFVSHQDWRAIIGGLMGVSWIGTTVTGLLLGQSSSVGKNHTLFETVGRAAPYVFVVGALILVSYGSNELIHRAYFDYPAGFAPPANTKASELKSKKLSYLQNLDRPTNELIVQKFPRRTVPAIVCLAVWAATAFGLASLLSMRVGVNAFSLHDLYALRLIRCYLGASRENRNPNPLTNLDSQDDLRISALALSNHANNLGPYPIINGTLNRKVADKHGSAAEQVAETLAFQDRQGESFVFTPQYCGSTTTGYCRTADFCDNVKLGTAVAVSGAAVSPNQGYHSSPAVAALLTVFNVRLGAWFGNPSNADVRSVRNPPGATLSLLKELLGEVKACGNYVYVSDGGHFENMGIYELIRRRCRFIVAIDSWADPKLSRENLGRVVRQSRIDFGIPIEIEIDSTRVGANGFCNSHFVLGKIHYGEVHPGEKAQFNDPNYNYDANQGILIYLKVGLTGDESNDLLNYQAEQPLFPHHPISDQFFDEAQFEAYRQLGYHTVQQMLQGRAADPSPGNVHESLAMNDEKIAARVKSESNRETFEDMFRRWMSIPVNRKTELYAQFNEDYMRLMSELRTSPELRNLAVELYGGSVPISERPLSVTRGSNAERLMVLEMMTLLGSVWFALDLDKNYKHPINSGWVKVVRRWMNSPIVQEHWTAVQDEFSKPFRDFLFELQR